MKGADMITPVWALTIDKLCERKNDLLFTDADIKELAKNERNKAIEEFTERIKTEFRMSVKYADEELRWIDEIAEQLKGGAE